MTMGQVPYSPEPRSRVERDAERPRLLPPVRLEQVHFQPPRVTLQQITINDYLQHSPWIGGTVCPDFGPVCARRSDRPKEVSSALDQRGQFAKAVQTPRQYGHAKPEGAKAHRRPSTQETAPSSRLSAASSVNPPLSAAHPLGNLTPKNREDYPHHLSYKNRPWTERCIPRTRIRWPRGSAEKPFTLSVLPRDNPQECLCIIGTEDLCHGSRLQNPGGPGVLDGSALPDYGDLELDGLHVDRPRRHPRLPLALDGNR
jgi:hypothetical protein